MQFKHTLMILSLVIALQGCAWLPHLSFDRPGTVPQSTEKTSKNIRCEGELNIGMDGSISCSKGFYSNESLFNMIERKLTWKEKIINWFSNLAGWAFPIVILICFLCPGLIGLIIGRIFNVFRTGLSSTVSAISSIKDKAKESNDPAYKKAVDDMIKELQNAHQEAGVEKLITKVRSEIS